MGVSVSVLRVSWMAAWIYFMIVGWASFLEKWNLLWPHVTLQFVASVSLIVSGVAIFQQWKRYRGIFLFSVGFLIISIFIAIIGYGPRGHGEPMFMYLISVWTLAVGGLLTTGTYFLDRLMSSDAVTENRDQSQ